MGNRLKEEVRKEIMLTDTPIVLAGTLDEEDKLPTIAIDYHQATKDATKFLVDKDHKNIALIGLDMVSAKHKFTTEGYREALEEAGLSNNGNFVYRPTNNIDKFEPTEIVDQILAEEVSAAIVEDDRMAIFILNELFARGINVPRDFEIITLNNSPLNKISRPRLTTISQPLYDIGAVAMRLLTKLMNEEETGDLHLYLPYKIKEAGTTK